MNELELGMRYADGSPKPVLLETGKFAEQLRSLSFDLPPCEEDAVCISTLGQKQWGVAFMATCLAKQAGITLHYSAPEQPLPSAKVYLLPSVVGTSILPRENYLALQQHVRNGATLYLSIDNAFLADFEPLTGLRVVDSCAGSRGTVTLGDVTVPIVREREFRLAPTTATVLATDDQGRPAIAVHALGKGKVICVNFPLESMLLGENEFTAGNYYQIYRSVFSDVLAGKTVTTENPFVGLTLHPDRDSSIVCAAVNYSDKPQKPVFKLRDDAEWVETLHGNTDTVAPFNVCFFRVRTK